MIGRDSRAVLGMGQMASLGADGAVLVVVFANIATLWAPRYHYQTTFIKSFKSSPFPRADVRACSVLHLRAEDRCSGPLHVRSRVPVASCLLVLSSEAGTQKGIQQPPSRAARKVERCSQYPCLPRQVVGVRVTPPVCHSQRGICKPSGRQSEAFCWALRGVIVWVGKS